MKLGSAVLTTATGDIDLAVLQQLCDEVAAQAKQGRRVVIVTSGAVAAGRGALGLRDRKPTIAVKQALAAVGQSRLMQMYTGFSSGMTSWWGRCCSPAATWKTGAVK